MNWNLLNAEEAETAWIALNRWVNWLRRTYGLPASVIPPLWHRHPELVWELSALHLHWLCAYDPDQHGSAPIGWLRDFTDARERLHDWVTNCGTRLDRDRATRQALGQENLRPRPSRTSSSRTATKTSSPSWLATWRSDARRSGRFMRRCLTAEGERIRRTAGRSGPCVRRPISAGLDSRRPTEHGGGRAAQELARPTTESKEGASEGAQGGGRGTRVARRAEECGHGHKIGQSTEITSLALPNPILTSVRPPPRRNVARRARYLAGRGATSPSP